jgi:hypothetical protein
MRETIRQESLCHQKGSTIQVAVRHYPATLMWAASHTQPCAQLLFFSDIDSRLHEKCYIYRPIRLSFSGKQPCIYKLCPLINHPGLVILTNTLQSDKYVP